MPENEPVSAPTASGSVPPAQSPIWMNHFKRWVAVAVLLTLAARAALVPIFIWKMLSYPIDYFFGEGDMLFYAQRVLHGKTIYTDSTSLPLIGNVYPPLYPWILSFLGRVTPLTLASARALQIVPLLGIMLLVGAWVRRQRAPVGVACAAALLVPCCYQFGEYILAPRPDSWMLLFLLGALYFVSRLDDTNDATRVITTRMVLLAAAASTLSLYAKHSALMPLAALQLHLLVRRPRQGLALIGATIGCCAVLLAVTLSLYGTVFFTSMLSPQAPRQIEWARVSTLMLPSLNPIAVIFCLGLGGLIHTLLQRRWTILNSLFMGSLPLAIVVLIDGGGPNHLLPLVATLLLSSALVARDVLTLNRFGIAPAVSLALAVALQVFLLTPSSDQTASNPLAAPNDAEFAGAGDIERFLTTDPGPVYAEREWGVIADRECADRYFIEPVHLRFLKAGALPPDVAEQPFRDQVFSRVLVFEQNFQPPNIRKEINKYYQPVHRGFIKVCAGTAGDTYVLFMVRRPMPLSEPHP